MDHRQPDDSPLFTDSEWRTLFQAMPRNVYDRLIEEMKRVGHANGIAPEVFEADDKENRAIGPRILAWECLVILLERSDSEAFRV